MSSSVTTTPALIVTIMMQYLEQDLSRLAAFSHHRAPRGQGMDDGVAQGLYYPSLGRRKANGQLKQSLGSTSMPISSATQGRARFSRAWSTTFCGIGSTRRWPRLVRFCAIKALAEPRRLILCCRSIRRLTSWMNISSRNFDILVS